MNQKLILKENIWENSLWWTSVLIKLWPSGTQPTILSKNGVHVRPFNRSAEKTNVLTEKPPRWSLLFRKAADLEFTPAIKLKKDSARVLQSSSLQNFGKFSLRFFLTFNGGGINSYGGVKIIWGSNIYYYSFISISLETTKRSEKWSLSFQNFFRKCECFRSCYLPISSNLLKKVL